MKLIICILLIFSAALNSGRTFQTTAQNNALQSSGSIYTGKTSKITFTGNSINNVPLAVPNAGTIAETNAFTFINGAGSTNARHHFAKNHIDQ